jgi:predicted TIM-barrel fold metal-dependent hydrolase
MPEPTESFKNNKSIINCHTHIFTGDHVPPFLARTFLPWPFYFFLPLTAIVKAFRFWYNTVEPKLKDPNSRKGRERMYKIRMFVQRTGLVRLVVFFIGWTLTVSTFFILVDWLSAIQSPVSGTKEFLDNLRKWFSDRNIPTTPESFSLRILIVLALIIFFKAGRNVIWFLMKKIWGFLGVLPGPKSKALAKRYLNIGRFAFHSTQLGTWEQLQAQYPEGTGFIVLPMDMEYMGAGNVKKGKEYFHQMEELRAIKASPSNKDFIYPFVFAEPRRIADEKRATSKRKKILYGGKVQLEWSSENGVIKLEDCFIRDYIETYKFSGFKIYPALGYYPFDKELLPLWKYAADNGLPILTHCIRGNIYYRGAKEKCWDKHPVFRQASGNQDFDDHLALMEIKNSEFINNFTHPMNYLCLLEEKLLREVVEISGDQQIKDLFGYTAKEKPLKYNLSHLKLCFGHFGGDDEWERFMELDRDLHTRQLVKHPNRGILFFTDNNGVQRKGKPEQIWKSVDWYSIICSMMLQYENVYADLSYILHNSEIHPLLKQTLMNPKLRKRILFGTDFYMVRNHKSEKGLLAALIDHLSEDEFEQIATINPREFVKSDQVFLE